MDRTYEVRDFIRGCISACLRKTVWCVVTGRQGQRRRYDYKIKHYLYDKAESEQAEEPYVAAIHRLDRPVGGVMVFAKLQR